MPAKKSKPKDEWSEWGDALGDRLKKQGKEFAEEVGDIGERIEDRFEKRKARRHYGFFFWSFGLIGPLLGTIFGLLVLIIGIALLNWLNGGLGSTFISALSSFLSDNLAWFFLAGLFFGYARFLVRSIAVLRPIFSPLVSAASLTFTAWILSGLFLAINVSAKSGFLNRVAVFLSSNLVGIFLFFLVLGYAWVVVKAFLAGLWWDQ